MAPITLDVLAERMDNYQQEVRGDLREIKQDAKARAEAFQELAISLSSRVSRLDAEKGFMSGIMSKLSLGLLTKVTFTTGGVGGLIFAAIKMLP